MEGALSGDIPGLNFYNSKWERCIEVCGPTGPRAHPTIVFNCASYRPHAVDHDTEIRAMVSIHFLLLIQTSSLPLVFDLGLDTHYSDH